MEQLKKTSPDRRAQGAVRVTPAVSRPFQIRRSRIQGMGLFARVTLPARKKIGELTGDLISVRQARRLARNRACIAVVELDDRWAIDATAGNEFRYLNHCCAPNTFLRIIGRRIEVYALREIVAGEELTCDYGESHHEGKLHCACGSERCRGWL